MIYVYFSYLCIPSSRIGNTKIISSSQSPYTWYQLLQNVFYKWYNEELSLCELPLTLKENFPHNTCQIYIKLYSKHIKNYSRMTDFCLKGTGLCPSLLLHLWSLNNIPWRVFNAAITRVLIQSCDVNPKQPIHLCCNKRSGIKKKYVGGVVRDWRHRHEQERWQWLRSSLFVVYGLVTKSGEKWQA